MELFPPGLLFHKVILDKQHRLLVTFFGRIDFSIVLPWLEFNEQKSIMFGFYCQCLQKCTILD